MPAWSEKRQLKGHIPTPQELERVFKKPKRGFTEKVETFSRPLFVGIPPFPSLVDEAPLSHNVPQDAVPILKPPYQVDDFFSDFTAQLEPKAKAQLKKCVQTYAPPKAPRLSRNEAVVQPGIMVPFVYPPIPSIEYDAYANMPGSSDDEEDYYDSDSNSDEFDDSEDSEDFETNENANRLFYPAMAPLPFPPPNYMPYPLISEKAPPTPHEVFEKWLDASEHLPRVDMVVASAAGSIYDLRAAADACGLTVTKLQEMIRLGQLAESEIEVIDEKSDLSDSSDNSDSEYRQFMDYYAGIDVTTIKDLYAKEYKKNVVVVNSDLKNKYMNVDTRGLKKVLQAKPSVRGSAFILSSEEAKINDKISSMVFCDAEDITDASGENKEERRETLVKLYNSLEDHFQKNKDAIFVSRKRELLEKLSQLRSSEVYFDYRKNKIDNEDLQRYANKRQEEVEGQIISLKNSSNYERLKGVLSFYQTSSRSYRAMNQVMLNKLQKMKNFIEYQKQILKDHSSEGDAGENDLLNIRNRDIAKFYESFVDQDYSNEIKEVCRATVEDDQPYDLEPSLFKKVYTGYEHSANVHDFMPLVTRNEFRLITGEAPSKVGPPKDSVSKGKGARHQIFQSSLYDRLTSGSDTNASDNGLPMKKRPGRRAAPKPTYSEEVSKHTNDAALTAKIMKQFIGPAAATAQELTEDLGLIGIQTKWPIK